MSTPERPDREEPEEQVLEEAFRREAEELVREAEKITAQEQEQDRDEAGD